MNGLDFPDQIHLEKIRTDLWCGREYGRAAAMIGSASLKGSSLNNV